MAAQQPLGPDRSGGVHAVGASIKGNAVTSAGRPIAEAAVRLRNARSGHIVGRTATDQTGLFAFAVGEPGTYVVEIVGKDERVAAASQILNVNAGETVTAIVKMAFPASALSALLGPSTPSAAVVVAAAATAGVLATQVSGEPSSPRR